MKKLTVIIGAVFTAAVINLNAQTVTATNSVPMPPMPVLGNTAEDNLAQQFYDATIGNSNGVFVATAARKLIGNANRFSLDYVYNLTPENPNATAGLILGIDDIRAGGFSEANVLKGGLTLKANVYPFKNFGATNFFVTPYVFALIATPTQGTGNNGGIGELDGAGISYEHWFGKNVSVEAGAFYENATGEGQFNGNWAGVLLGLHYKF